MVVAVVALDAGAARALTRAGVCDSKAVAGKDAIARRAELAALVRARAPYVALCGGRGRRDRRPRRARRAQPARARARVRLIAGAPSCARIIADGARMFAPLRERSTRSCAPTTAARRATPRWRPRRSSPRTSATDSSRRSPRAIAPSSASWPAAATWNPADPRVPRRLPPRYGDLPPRPASPGPAAATSTDRSRLLDEARRDVRISDEHVAVIRRRRAAHPRASSTAFTEVQSPRRAAVCASRRSARALDGAGRLAIASLGPGLRGLFARQPGDLDRRAEIARRRRRRWRGRQRVILVGDDHLGGPRRSPRRGQAPRRPAVPGGDAGLGRAADRLGRAPRTDRGRLHG
jgi:hypothetical protein